MGLLLKGKRMEEEGNLNWNVKTSLGSPQLAHLKKNACISLLQPKKGETTLLEKEPLQDLVNLFFLFLSVQKDL